LQNPRYETKDEAMNATLDQLEMAVAKNPKLAEDPVNPIKSRGATSVLNEADLNEPMPEEDEVFERDRPKTFREEVTQVMLQTEQYCNTFWMTEKEEKKWMDPHFHFFPDKETEEYRDRVKPTTAAVPCEDLPTSSKKEVVCRLLYHKKYNQNYNMNVNIIELNISVEQ
jgi:hypothetical protein